MVDEAPSSAVRIWNFLNTAELKKELLFIEDNYGQCASCKQLGINYVTTPVCPGCQTTFKYIAAKPGSDPVKILKRIQAEGLALKLVERSDLEKADSRDKLSGLFGA